MRNLTSDLTSATRNSVFGTILEILETPRPNIMYYWLHSFFLQKKEKVAKTTSHKIYSDVASGGKKEGFLIKLRTLCKLHTFTIFFLLLYGFIYRILIPVYTHSKVLQLSWPSIFSNDYWYRTQTQLAPESNTFSQDRAAVSGFIHQEKWVK